MELNTASSAISFAKRLEDESMKFYESFSEQYPEIKEISVSLISENKKNKTFIDTAYYGVISDALEGCFSFEGIDTDDFVIEAGLAEGTSYADALNMAIAMEEKITKFYLAAAEVSRSLMADVPRAFEKIAKKRTERIDKLRSRLGGD